MVTCQAVLNLDGEIASMSGKERTVTIAPQRGQRVVIMPRKSLASRRLQCGQRTSLDKGIVLPIDAFDVIRSIAIEIEPIRLGRP